MLRQSAVANMKLPLKNVPWGGLILVSLGAVCYDLTKFLGFSAFLAGFILLYFACRLRFTKSDFIWLSFCLLCVAMLYVSELTPPKKFYRFYTAIEAGMDEGRLLLLENEYFPAGGKFGQLRKTTTSFHPPKILLSYTVDPVVEPVQQDIIHVELMGGKAVSKEWLAD